MTALAQFACGVVYWGEEVTQMEKRIFLTGPQGAGKSRLIREALGGKLAWAGGFVMAAERGDSGYAEGYALCPAAAAAGVEGLEARRFLDCRVWPPVRDNEVLRGYGVQLLREAAYYPFALLDELGGFELLLPQFRQALAELLRSGLPLVGALKTPEEAEQWRQLYGLGERFTAQTDALRLWMEQDADTRILDLRDASESEALTALRAWAEAYT